MPSSTFSFSDPIRRDRGWLASVVLLACAGAIFLCAESSCRLVVPRISRIERRTAGEISAALAMGRESDRLDVLVVGNSLLLHGVEFEEVQGALGPSVNVQRLVIENTRFFDWYYGVRRLRASGSRPDWIVVVLSPDGIVSREVRGEYFAYRLMDGGDLPLVQRDVGLTNTVASNYAFANVSAFFGLRAEVHKVVLSTLFTDLEALTTLMTQQRTVKALKGRGDFLVRSRLGALSDFASASGIRLAVVIPPLGETDADLVAELTQQGRGVGIPVLMPVAPGALPPDYYSDGFHLNEEGAKVFTPEFVAVLQELTGDPVGSRSQRTVRTSEKERN